MYLWRNHIVSRGDGFRNSISARRQALFIEKKTGQKQGKTIMATLTWIGGGNNKASNPNDWSPTGAPEPSDTLQISGPGTYTMNVRGNDLMGDTLGISYADATLNLSRNAAVTARVGDGADVKFNLLGVSHLDLSASGSNVANGGSSDTVNLARNSVWIGSFNMGYAGHLSTSAGAHSLFINDGDSGVARGSAVLAMPVVGTGSISDYASRLEFASSVGAHLSVGVSGEYPGAVIAIDHPYEYHASTSMGAEGEIDLVGLAHADSYTFKNDMLAIYSGNCVIYSMRLQAYSGFGAFEVAQTPSGVNIFSTADPNNPPAGALPIHTGA